MSLTLNDDHFVDEAVSQIKVYFDAKIPNLLHFLAKEHLKIRVMLFIYSIFLRVNQQLIINEHYHVLIT